jgi:hypothetical protein
MECKALACNIKIITRPLYLYMGFDGVWSVGDAARAIHELSAGLTEGHDWKVMWDLRGLQLDTTRLNDYEEACLFASEFIARPLRLALLHGPEKPNSVDFRELVARNRGVDVRTFDSEDAAVQWLTGVRRGSVSAGSDRIDRVVTPAD